MLMETRRIQELVPAQPVKEEPPKRVCIPQLHRTSTVIACMTHLALEQSHSTESNS